MTDRRNFLSITSAGAAISSGSAQAGDAQFSSLPKSAGRTLANLDRARTVMERYQIDGLIAANPLNVYYLTNTVTLSVKFQSELGGFATMARDPKAPRFLVCTTAETWDIANRDRELPEVIYFTGIKSPADAKPGVEPEASRPRDYASRAGAAFTPREQAWTAAQQAANNSVAPGAAWAIARALKQSGLTKGRIAVDDMRVKYLLDDIGLTGITVVPGDDIFKLIRMVKTEPEIDLMRIAGINNAEAAYATMNRFRPGMTFDDFQNMFRQECADRGNQIMSIICGMPGGMMPEPEAVRGKPYIVDAVSAYSQYNGDYARTLVLGEPSKETLFRAKANRIARDTVFDLVKPGVKFSTLRQVAFDAMVKAGIPENLVFITPHCVGLSHTDQPYRLPGFEAAPLEHVLEENMVLTIDLPYLEVGYGGGHCEDLFRVTKTGYESFTREGDPLVVV